MVTKKAPAKKAPAKKIAVKKAPAKSPVKRPVDDDGKTTGDIVRSGPSK